MSKGTKREHVMTYRIVSFSKVVKRFILIVVWIVFYFMLIDVVYSLLSYGTLSVLWVSSFCYLFAGLATALGLETDYVCRTFFKWYITQSSKVFVSLVVTSIILGSIQYYFWLVMVP